MRRSDLLRTLGWVGAVIAVGRLQDPAVVAVSPVPQSGTRGRVLATRSGANRPYTALITPPHVYVYGCT